LADRVRAPLGNWIVTDIGIIAEKSDGPLLVPAAERHIEAFGRAPLMAATDRGFYSGKGERRIGVLGVKRPVIPKPGHKGKKRVAHERQRWFRRGRAWRAGGEVRISRLKHRFGMAQSLQGRELKGRSSCRRSPCAAAQPRWVTPQVEPSASQVEDLVRPVRPDAGKTRFPQG
jgi:hypothetical protein